METVQPHAPTHKDRTSTAHLAHTSAQFESYTAQQVADRYPELAVKEVTVRTRWFDWLKKVAPEPLLKVDKSFTAFAVELFDDFAQNVKIDRQKPEEWVSEAKAHYSQEWGSAGVIEGELMPEGVGGTLALAQTTAITMQQQGDASKLKLLRLIEQARSAESSLSQSQREIARQRGVNSAIDEFQVELEAKLETLSELRQKLGL
jgi:hypothetical protein